MRDIIKKKRKKSQSNLIAEVKQTSVNLGRNLAPLNIKKGEINDPKFALKYARKRNQRKATSLAIFYIHH